MSPPTSGATSRRWAVLAHPLRILWRNQLRSLLVIGSAALGVTGVVCARNYAEAGSRQLLAQMRRMGTNLILISPRQSRVVAGRERSGATVTTLSEGDYSAILRELPGRSRSSAVVTQSFRAANSDLSKSVTVVGCEPDYFVVREWPLTSGAVFGIPDLRAMRRVAVLGHTVARDLFGGDAVGRRIRIARIPFTVIGVLSERGQGLDTGNDDDQIYIPLTTGMHRLMNVTYYSAIVLEIASLGAMDDAAAQIQTLLRRRHHLRDNQPDDFVVGNQKRLLEDRRAAAARLRTLVDSAAAGALILSSGGIIGISLLAVKQRTREIGTLRALGATTGHVFVQFLLESATLATLGAAAGLGLAYAGSALIARQSQLPFAFLMSQALAAAGVALALNLICALLPARHAARLDPIEALRRE